MAQLGGFTCTCGPLPRNSLPALPPDTSLCRRGNWHGLIDFYSPGKWVNGMLYHQSLSLPTAVSYVWFPAGMVQDLLKPEAEHKMLSDHRKEVLHNLQALRRPTPQLQRLLPPFQTAAFPLPSVGSGGAITFSRSCISICLLTISSRLLNRSGRLASISQQST